MKWSFLMLVFALSTPAAECWADTIEISQQGRAFHPDEVTIKVGDQLLIRNDDEFIHHIYVKSDDFNYDSTEQPPGNSLRVPFTHIGDYTVRCEIHPKMRLLVHVKGKNQ